MPNEKAFPPFITLASLQNPNVVSLSSTCSFSICAKAPRGYVGPLLCVVLDPHGSPKL